MSMFNRLEITTENLKYACIKLFFKLLFLEAGSYYVAQDSLEFMIFPPQPLGPWGQKHASPFLV